MKTDKPDPEEQLLDHRLKRGIRKTTPSFEARFERIRFQPQDRKTTQRRSVFIRLPVLAPLAAAAALALVVWLQYPANDDPANGTFAVRTDTDVYLEDPYLWDDALAPALPVLDPDTFEAVYYFAFHENTH